MTKRPAHAEPRNTAPSEPVDRRRSVARTAWTMAGIAFAIYVLFILSGVLAQ